jgi:hypothetical protein
MSVAEQQPLPPVRLGVYDVFPPRPGRPNNPYITVEDWSVPVMYFVGRNGSGKSRTARKIAETLNGRLLPTDRLSSLMSFTTYPWGSIPTSYKGAPLSEQERNQLSRMAVGLRGATEELYALREQPDVWLRVAAFLRRTLGRDVELRESAGYLDPYVRIGDLEYSLLRDEGHGLRELVVLLAVMPRDVVEA